MKLPAARRPRPLHSPVVWPGIVAAMTMLLLAISPPAAIANGQLELTINDVTQAELQNGTSLFTFTVRLSAAADTGGVVFDIATANNTATTPDNDYVQKSLIG